MAPAIDLRRLPTTLRSCVAMALDDVDACEGAIDRIEAYLSDKPARPPDVLLALAVLTYREAEQLVLSRLEEASERAIALIDEAVTSGAQTSEEIDELRSVCEAAIARERAREEKLLGKLRRGAHR